jgi:hypothetical protein
MLLEVSGELIGGCLLPNLLKRYLPCQHRDCVPVPHSIAPNKQTVVSLKNAKVPKVTNLVSVLAHYALSSCDHGSRGKRNCGSAVLFEWL